MGYKSMHGDWYVEDEPLRLWHLAVLAVYPGIPFGLLIWWFW